MTMVDGTMLMAAVKLRPEITPDPGADIAKARALVENAHRQCFIGNSVSAKVDVEPDISFAAEPVPAQ